MSNQRRGTWALVTDRGLGSSQGWPPSAAVSTSSLIVSSEHPGHFASVCGTDKIVLNGTPTTSHQTAPVRDEHHRESDQ
jgi:hypothetical protein